MTDFAKYFNIPYRTIQNWEAGTRQCPEYVVELIKYKLEKELIEGEWVSVGDWMLTCSVCDNVIEDMDSDELPSFCQHCGSKMGRKKRK